MSNSNSGALNGQIINSVAAVYTWKGLMPAAKKVVTLPGTDLAKFTEKTSSKRTRLPSAQKISVS